MKKQIVVLLFVLFFSIPNQAFAAQSLSISNIPSTIDQSQEFSINAFLSCSGCSDSYMRGVFYPSGTSYFGYTQDNNGNWSNAPGSGCTTYFKIAQSDLQGGSWSGTLKFKPDKDSPYYNGPGEYLFKVGRYTPSCSSPSVWSTETTIAITGPTPTPSPSPTPNPTSTEIPTNTPTPAKATSVKATAVKTLTPTKISPAATQAQKTNNSAKITKEKQTSMGGALKVKEPSPKKSKEVKVLGTKENNFSVLIVLGGLLLLIGGGSWFGLKIIREKGLYEKIFNK